jgi:signal transduction histidine kinase
MSLGRSVLNTGAPSGIGTGSADRFVRRGFDVLPLPRRTNTEIQRRFRPTEQKQAHLEEAIRLEERRRERSRIVRELHDTLLQGFLGASMLLDHTVEQTPPDSPSKPALRRTLRLVRQAIDEGRAALRGLHTASPSPLSLEEAFSNLLSEVTTGGGPGLRIEVQGKPRTLNAAIQEQLFLIGREAVMNVLRHSHATKIEIEVQYEGDLVRMVVRDNGCGINPESVQRKSDSHWGLCGMRERSENIGARFGIWSRPGAGTEVRVAVPVDAAKRSTRDRESWEGGTAV